MEFIRHLPSGVFCWDNRSGRVSLHNPLATQLLKQVAGWRPGQVLDRLGAVTLAGTVERACREPIELTLTSAMAGPVANVRLHATRMPEAPGDSCYLIIIEDVTAEHRRDELAASQDRLATIGQLASGIAHDFNNLLMVMVSSCAFLREDMATDSESLQDVALIENATERAVKLTRQMLAFSRKQVLHPELLDANGLVKELQQMLSRILPEAIRLETAPAAAPMWIHADPGEVERVLVNLVVNARDALPNGGFIRVSSRVVHVDDSNVSRTPDLDKGAHVVLSVTDNGEGMAQETLRHAFEPFFTTKRRGQGTGLGLSGVYGAVKQSGGTVVIDSRLGHGTTVDVYLPFAATTEPAALALAATSQAADRPTTRVLLVEDCPAVRSVTTRQLQRDGAVVTAVEDAEQALARVQACPGDFDVVLSDIGLPGMSGRELASELGQLSMAPPIILMSGYPEGTGEIPGASSPLGFLQKPLTAQALRESIRKVARIRRAS